MNGPRMPNGLMGMPDTFNGGDMSGMMSSSNGISDSMEMAMMHGMGANHNVVMNSNHIGMYGNSNGLHSNHNPHNNQMNMGMMNGEGMLPIPMQMNNIMMMLQNPQLPQPMRMQLMMQHQQLQQMFVMQNMGGGQASMNNHLSSQSQCPPHMMQMNMMNGNGASNLNGMMSSNMGPKPPSSGISGGMAHSGPGNNRGRGGSHHFQQRSQPPRGPSANHSMNGSSAYQRLPTNGRRPNANKRGRSEDLIELQSGEKVPRYM